MTGSTTSGPSEFELIETLLKPLSSGAPGAFALTDDAAVLPDLAPGESHVVTKDALSVGVHMREDDSPSSMAQKALRVNLSDLAAMGARPVGFFMSLCLGADTQLSFVQDFVAGLAQDITEFSVPLMGGDIIKTAGSFMVSITAIGSVNKESLLRRTGAQPGNSLWVSGFIGDGSLGLKALAGELSDLPADAQTHLADRYRVPQPRVALGQSLAGVAMACIDISDGLIADVGHICRQSGVGCRITADNVPLSDSAKAAIKVHPHLLEHVLAGGDDYELAWAMSEELENTIPALAGAADVPVSRIGVFTEGEGVQVVGPAGENLTVAQDGYRHI